MPGGVTVLEAFDQLLLGSGMLARLQLDSTQSICIRPLLFHSCRVTSAGLCRWCAVGVSLI